MRVVLSACAIVVSLLCLLASVRFLLPTAGTNELPGAAEKQLEFVRSALEGGADHDAQRQFPEGYLFANALYGMAWVQVGLTDTARADAAVKEARWALSRIESSDGTAPFSAGLVPAYGVFYAGWTNWLRGGIIALQEVPDASESARYEQASAELAAAFERSATPFLQAYPQQAWPVDSTVAIASLALHDQLVQPRFDDTIARWLGDVRERLDPATGLLPHRVDPIDGRPIEGARATSQSVIHRFLVEIDPAFAREQYEGFRARFLAYPLGFGPAVREYPHGTDGVGDVDSGPLVLGISLSATAVTLGAARVNGDNDLAAALASEAELLGAPVSGLQTKRYALGLLPIGDAFLVWSATARPWGVAQQPEQDFDIRWWWRLPWLTTLVVVTLIAWLPVLALRRKQPRAGDLRPNHQLL